MNIQKFTQKSVEAINDCEKLAYEYGNQEIEQEHLLVALMRQEDGLIPRLIERMRFRRSTSGITPSGIWQRVSRCPAVRSMSDRI